MNHQRHPLALFVVITTLASTAAWADTAPAGFFHPLAWHESLHPDQRYLQTVSNRGMRGMNQKMGRGSSSVGRSPGAAPRSGPGSKLGPAPKPSGRSSTATPTVKVPKTTPHKAKPSKIKSPKNIPGMTLTTGIFNQSLKRPNTHLSRHIGQTRQQLSRQIDAKQTKTVNAFSQFKRTLPPSMNKSATKKLAHIRRPLPPASSFISKADAQKYMGGVIRIRNREIQKWLKGAPVGKRAAFEVRNGFGRTTGYTLKPGSNKLTPTRGVRVVLEKTGLNKYLIHNGYPR